MDYGKKKKKKVWETLIWIVVSPTIYIKSSAWRGMKYVCLLKALKISVAKMLLVAL